MSAGKSRRMQLSLSLDTSAGPSIVPLAPTSLGLVAVRDSSTPTGKNVSPLSKMKIGRTRIGGLACGQCGRVMPSTGSSERVDEDLRARWTRAWRRVGADMAHVDVAHLVAARRVADTGE